MLKGIAKKAAKSELGRKRFIIVWDELMTCQVPKISGYLGGCATKIRIAIWRSTGFAVGNATTAYMGDTVSYYNKLAEKKFAGTKTVKKITEMVKFALNFTSLGAIVAFALEKGDGVNNENYVYFNI